MSRRSLLGITAAATVMVALTASPAQAAGHTLVVNVASPFRPVTHVASGGLYALAENNRPADSTLSPIRMNTLTQPPPGVSQRPNGQPPGGDALEIAPQADRVGAAQVIRMPAGSMVITTPPAQSGIDGFASYDSTRKRVDVVFGDEAGTNSVRHNGGAWSTVSYPPTAGWAQFGTVSTTVALRAGYNVIRLAKARRSSAVATASPSWTTSN